MLTQPIAPENRIDRLSRRDAINNKSVNDAALRQARLRHSALETALGQLAEPEFRRNKIVVFALRKGRAQHKEENPL